MSALDPAVSDAAQASPEAPPGPGARARRKDRHHESDPTGCPPGDVRRARRGVGRRRLPRSRTPVPEVRQGDVDAPGYASRRAPEQQSGLMLHRTRHLFIRQQTAVINTIRAHLAELGIVAPVGRKGVEELLNVVADPADKRVPDIARACLAALGAHLRRLKEQILEFDRMIMAWHRSNETSQRLDAIPGVGPMLATALVVGFSDPKVFRSGRNFSAWISAPKKN